MRLQHYTGITASIYMSKQRALELCDRAELNPGPDRCVLLIEAIQELAKDDLNRPDANLDDLLTELQGIRDEIREFKDCVMSLAPPPKSDPPSPT